MKKEGYIFLIVILLLSLVSCSGGSYKITVGDIGSTSNEITGQYRSFTGHYFKKVKLDQGDSLIVKFTADTEKGKIKTKIIDNNDETIETMNPGDTIELSDPDKYKLQVEGKKHRGSFILSWEKE